VILNKDKMKIQEKKMPEFQSGICGDYEPLPLVEVGVSYF
jgi:hypothetical protein